MEETTGTTDIGLRGATSGDPNSPDFLGLPVLYDAFFIPHGLELIPGNVVGSQEGLVAMFHVNAVSPSGEYHVVPTHGCLVLLCVSGFCPVARRRR